MPISEVCKHLFERFLEKYVSPLQKPSSSQSTPKESFKVCLKSSNFSPFDLHKSLRSPRHPVRAASLLGRDGRPTGAVLRVSRAKTFVQGSRM
jgi:hypothetical protein